MRECVPVTGSKLIMGAPALLASVSRLVQWLILQAQAPPHTPAALVHHPSRATPPYKPCLLRGPNLPPPHDLDGTVTPNFTQVGTLPSAPVQCSRALRRMHLTWGGGGEGEVRRLSHSWKEYITSSQHLNPRLVTCKTPAPHSHCVRRHKRPPGDSSTSTSWMERSVS